MLVVNSLRKTYFLIFWQIPCFPRLERWTFKFPVFPVPWQHCVYMVPHWFWLYFIFENSCSLNCDKTIERKNASLKSFFIPETATNINVNQRENECAGNRDILLFIYNERFPHYWTLCRVTLLEQVAWEGLIYNAVSQK